MDWCSRHISRKTAHGPQKHLRTNRPTRRTEKGAASPTGNRSARTTQGERFCWGARLHRLENTEDAEFSNALAIGCAANCRVFLTRDLDKALLADFLGQLTFLPSLLPMAKRQARRSEIRPRLLPDKRLRSRIISKRRWRERFRLQQVLQVDLLCVPTLLASDCRAPDLPFDISNGSRGPASSI